jgi:hypothetical protein
VLIQLVLEQRTGLEEGGDDSLVTLALRERER